MMSFKHKLIGIQYKMFSGGDALNRLLEKIAVQAEYGRGIQEIVEDLARRAQKRGASAAPELKVLTRCKSIMAHNGSLADGLMPWLSPVAYALISNGSTSGKLPDALNLAAKLNRMGGAMAKEALTGLVQPVLSILILYYFVRFLSDQVTSSFGNMLRGHPLTGIAAATMQMGAIAHSDGIFVIFGALIVLAVLALWSLPRWQGKVRTFFDKAIPPYTIYRRIQGATWLISYAALLESGMESKQVLQHIRQTASPWLEERLKTVQLALAKGRNIGEALRLSGYGFPSVDIIDDLEIFSTFPNLQAKLMVLAEQSLADTRTSVSLTNKIISEVSKMVVAVIFAVMFFGLMGIIQSVAGSAGI